MMIEEICPHCGHVLMHTTITTYPPINCVECPNCGFRNEHREEIVYVPYNKDKKTTTLNTKAITSLLADVFDEHFSIPCDLCHKYIEHGDGGCPKCIKKCNGHEHWKMLMGRILDGCIK